ncbi:MAG: peptidoglycan DD-metalloendopeptidase family protein [Cytophagales bacterium]|uniref:M23 family metallopeptidase n=1 Tax=Cyclobacterium marinum TaxID=104 RepID=UPI0011EF0564|nr:M23 family metallopeptidase [Cyclobacterium marinum]MBI0400204.1 peptidoglycan DD-metalloendopeptidase family protein [Cyclobacterium marinum]MBR9775705.1 peptidoglycan DD-metalloendopeptidase family protein [Cytophagales bacterium]|tara:strand:+ start:7553 stop:8584 length:1032 start_codon:yes stop_codon:yes gene_type:complete
MSLKERWLLVLLLLTSFSFGSFAQIKKGNKHNNGVVEQNLVVPYGTLDFDADQYRNDLEKATDALIFKDGLDLKKRLSLVSENHDAFIWAPTHVMVEVAEKVMIDSIWITAFEHYGSWDSHKINSYDFDPREFKDTIPVTLYNSYYGSGWSAPLEHTKINSDFGRRRYRWHHGIDLKLNTGDPVRSVFDGIVRITSYERYGYGHYVVIRHRNGLETIYGHLSKKEVKVGQEIKAGDIIGLGGSTGRSTGPHLHFEIRYQGLSINPTEIFDFEIGRIKAPIYSITAQSFDHEIKMREAVYHRIRSGDNLSVIARRYGVRVSQITRLNGISTRTILKIGRRLQIQ